MNHKDKEVYILCRSLDRALKFLGLLQYGEPDMDNPEAYERKKFHLKKAAYAMESEWGESAA